MSDGTITIIVAIIAGIIPAFVGVYAARRQYEANTAKMVVDRAIREDDQARELTKLQEEIERALWAQVRDEVERWRGEVVLLRQELDTARAELSLTNKQVRNLTSQLHAAESVIERWRGDYKKLELERNKLTERVQKLERILEKNNLDTGPLDQGVKK